MKTHIWMPLYIGDYTRDTIGLSKAEHGSYILAIMAYWSKGEALTFPEMKAICGNDVDRITRFFISCDGRWHHKRIDEELAKAGERKEMARKKALLGVAARLKGKK